MIALTFDYNVASLNAVIGRVETWRQTKRAAVGRGLYEEAQAIITTSKTHFVPVDFGPLRDSGHVNLPVDTGDDITVTMGFGGAASAYAIAIHEHLSQYSPPSWVATERAGRHVQFSPAGTGPKYLERPFLEALQGMTARLAARVRDA